VLRASNSCEQGHQLENTTCLLLQQVTPHPVPTNTGDSSSTTGGQAAQLHGSSSAWHTTRSWPRQIRLEGCTFARLVPFAPKAMGPNQQEALESAVVAGRIRLQSLTQLAARPCKAHVQLQGLKLWVLQLVQCRC